MYRLVLETNNHQLVLAFPITNNLTFFVFLPQSDLLITVIENLAFKTLLSMWTYSILAIYLLFLIECAWIKNLIHS